MSEAEENKVLTFGELMRRKGHPELAPPEPEAVEPTKGDEPHVPAMVTGLGEAMEGLGFAGAKALLGEEGLEARARTEVLSLKPKARR